MNRIETLVSSLIFAVSNYPFLSEYIRGTINKKYKKII